MIVILQADFEALDQHPQNGGLSYDEAMPYLSSGINEYLSEQKILNITMSFVQVDLNRDASLSLQEWYGF
jgi:hypothetical protein